MLVKIKLFYILKKQINLADNLLSSSSLIALKQTKSYY